MSGTSLLKDEHKVNAEMAGTLLKWVVTRRPRQLHILETSTSGGENVLRN